MGISSTCAARATTMMLADAVKAVQAMTALDIEKADRPVNPAIKATLTGTMRLGSLSELT
jgi:hypothetical protein